MQVGGFCRITPAESSRVVEKCELTELTVDGGARIMKQVRPSVTHYNAWRQSVRMHSSRPNKQRSAVAEMCAPVRAMQ